MLRGEADKLSFSEIFVAWVELRHNFYLTIVSCLIKVQEFNVEEFSFKLKKKTYTDIGAVSTHLSHSRSEGYPEASEFILCSNVFSSRLPSHQAIENAMSQKIPIRETGWDLFVHGMGNSFWTFACPVKATYKCFPWALFLFLIVFLS